jgi:hypothetical protein
MKASERRELNKKNSTKTRQSSEKPAEKPVVKKDADAVRAQRIANLIPGANKNGRPKGKLNYDTRVDMAIEVLANKYVEEQNTKNKGKKGYVPLTIDDVDIEGDIFAQHINKARNGDRHFIDSFLDRRHGKATQRVEMSGVNGNPIEHAVKVEEAKKKVQGFFARFGVPAVVETPKEEPKK